MNPLPAGVPALVRARVRAAVRRPDRTAPGRRGRLTPEEAEARTLLLRLCSLLLQYPDAELATTRPVLTSTVAALPASPAAGHLAGFTAWLTAQEPDALERHYVEMFDLRRKSSLYLTYYLHGDTRRRGMALLILNQRYRAAGWDTDGGELPDHLPVVLEFAALVGTGAGEAPLRQHRRGLELIHRALTDAGSPYRHVLAALLTLLPPPTEEDRAAVARLVAEGPPNEEVGLDPYGTYGEGEFAPPGTFVPPPPAAPTRVPPVTPPFTPPVTPPSRTEGRR
ncbi:nitrate reductase molybdenum cofactor assembly chaperone [Streptomyces cathayae]|uniref:Nitrate reductase molybdenum cofactor assembly chaperone n=1 Tax=Streptomyces cathayae TaxID=3031124 RepID=A0ABY8JUV0_9ACTN|nr:nitrate reductase molybdenum cofactor assembly chaperone [Streptomyces sp. HUAS 5]WGD38984.1 nitrate reductase molybdenum cofactor assembly chaperone [Streptomyces sp. HUAS 5]